MPDAREVFEMVTQKSGPDVGALQRQHEAQDRQRRRQRYGAIAVAAAVIAALVVFFFTNPTRDSSRPVDSASVSTPPVIATSGATTAPALIGLDGQVIRTIALPADAWEPALSPDGRSIVYVTRSLQPGACGACTDAPRLAVVRVDGSGSRFLTQYGVTQYGDPRFADVSQPTWSPDGSRIAFVEGGTSGADGNIAVVDADGSNLMRLTNGSTQKGWPSWSPDGTSILYNDAGSTPLDDSGFSPTQELYSVPADGTGSPLRITNNHVDDSEASYSPDGTKIALFHREGIAIMNADGSNVRPLVSGFAPRWSRDGNTIAFLTYNPSERFALANPQTDNHDSFPRLDVKLLDVSTGDIQDPGVSVASDVNAVSWTPDSKGLLVNTASNT